LTIEGAVPKFLNEESAMPTMNVSLTEEIADFVEDEVASGDYVSASEVVREALRIMKHDRETEAVKLALLQREVGRGLAEAGKGAFSNRTVREIFDAVGDEPSA
jgi:antitoxin ParD1/3/4